MEQTVIQENPWYPRTKRITHLILLAVLCIVNVLLAITIAPEIANLGGIDYPRHQSDMMISASLTIFITYNFCGFIIANFVAMVPIKGLTYGQKYVRIAFNVMILIQLMMTIYAVLLHFHLMTPIGQG